jgi:hypothetical protein
MTPESPEATIIREVKALLMDVEWVAVERMTSCTRECPFCESEPPTHATDCDRARVLAMIAEWER